MKISDVREGGIYTCRVSGDVVRVRVDLLYTKSNRIYSRHNMGPAAGFQTQVWCQMTNLRTGRTIIGRPSRLREEVK